jgi:hypothetical protein
MCDPEANDFKIRYAFTDSPFYGCYMTDVIKRLTQVNSADVLRHLKETPGAIAEHIDALRQELKDLQATKPTILAFGVDVNRLLSAHLKHDEYARLSPLTHYSHRISQEDYKSKVLGQIYGQRQSP